MQDTKMTQNKEEEERGVNNKREREILTTS